MKNIIYLDVDGVLNPCKGKNPLKHWKDYRKYQTNPETTLKIWLSKELGEQLKRLPAELVWATTWEHYANEWISPILGLPELRVLPFLPDRKDVIKNSGKRTVVSSDSKDNAIVWIDDCLGPDDFAWINDRSLSYPTLGVKPKPSVGLTKTHLNQIEQFLLSPMV